MTQAPTGGPTQTTYRITDRALVTGRAAQRVFVVGDGRPVEGGPQQAVYYVSDAEIAAGEFVISGNKPIPITEVGASGATYPPIAVYVVTAASASDFPPVPDPAPPGPVPLLDLEADTLVLSDGDPVATWADQSGNNLDFTQNGAARPTYILNDGRGYPTVSFDGIDDYMLGSDFADNLNSFTLFVVHDLAMACIVSKMNNSSSGAGWALYASGNSGIIQEDGGSNWIEMDISTALSLGISTLQLISKAEMHMYINGDNSTEVDFSAPPVSNYSTTESVRLGVFGNLGTFRAGKIYAVRLYTPALASTDRAAVEAELAARYGITL